MNEPIDASRAKSWPIKQARQLIKEGHGDRALASLRAAIRSAQLAPEEIDQAGRLLTKAFASLAPGDVPLQAFVVGQCTTSWLPAALTAVAWGAGIKITAQDGGYDNVLQDLNDACAKQQTFDYVLLLPWNQRLLNAATNRSPAERIADEIAFWQQAWSLATRLSPRIVQVGYDWCGPGAMGYLLGRKEHAHLSLVRQLNEALFTQLPPGAAFVDLDAVAGMLGRERFYDARRYYWTKQPFGEEGLVRLAEHAVAAMRAQHTGPKKVLVLDLDNTLWGGVVGETGPLGVELGESPNGEAFRAFHRHVKALSQRGCLLAVCSKNNLDDARQPFLQNPSMHLKLDDFAAFEASWEPKSVAIRRIAATLRLGLDSFVFFDDNPFEREEVRTALPEVTVVNVPEDPTEYIAALERGLYFEAAALTAADSERAEQYRVEQQRRELEAKFSSLDDYLKSLEMQGTVSPVNDAEMPRAVQLLGKTNQFNLTTRRHTEADVRALLARPRSCGMTFRLADRFGDHGLIALVLAVPSDGDPRALRIDTLLMSCRVIGRTTEQFILRTLILRARELGYERLIGEFIPTAKNKQLVADLYDRLGFSRTTEAADGSVLYMLDLKTAQLPVTFIHGAAGSP
ncbi:MAG TPA: HAD-IIIC family phosphatase [Pirellulales bacterium]|nr:HAD-IIIC family phosphatase [Pirellulales bacterium]